MHRKFLLALKTVNTRDHTSFLLIRGDMLNGYLQLQMTGKYE